MWRKGLKGQIENLNKVDANIEGRGGCDFYYHGTSYILRAQKSHILDVGVDDNGKDWIKWQGIPYSTYKVDPETSRIEMPPIEEIPVVMSTKQINFF